MEERGILNAKKTELEGIVSRVFKQSRNMEELDKEVWKIRLERADDLLAVKKVCDDIIKWIDKYEPEMDKKSLEVFYGSLF